MPPIANSNITRDLCPEALPQSTNHPDCQKANYEPTASVIYVLNLHKKMLTFAV